MSILRSFKPYYKWIIFNIEKIIVDLLEKI